MAHRKNNSKDQFEFPIQTPKLNLEFPNQLEFLNQLEFPRATWISKINLNFPINLNQWWNDHDAYVNCNDQVWQVDFGQRVDQIVDWCKRWWNGLSWLKCMFKNGTMIQLESK